MDKNDIKKRIVTEEDYIRSSRFGNSLNRFLNKNSDGVKDSVIARLLMIPEKDVEKVYGEAVEMLRNIMVDDKK